MSIRSRLQAAEEENPLLPLVLGAIATLDAVEHALARDDDPAASATRPLGGAPLAPDDPFVLAALGLIGLGRTLHGWLATAAPPARDATHAAHRTRTHESLAR